MKFVRLIRNKFTSVKQKIVDLVVETLKKGGEKWKQTQP